MKWSGAWRRLGAGAVLVALLATGCSDAGGDVDPTPPSSTDVNEEPSATEPASPAPGPTPWPEPTRPAAMERDDIEGAKAAAEYFLALYPYVFATGDLDEWDAMSHPECRFCASVKSRAVELHEAGGFGLGGEILIRDIRALPPDDEYAHFRVGVRGTENPSSSHSEAGDELDSATGGDVIFTVGVLYDRRWMIRGLVMEGS